MVKISTSRRRNILKLLWNPNGGNKCYYCNEIIERKQRTIDHLIPHARGGRTDISNMVLACRPCNMAKADFTVAEFVDFVSQQGGIKKVKAVWGNQPQSKRDLLVALTNK